MLSSEERSKAHTFLMWAKCRCGVDLAAVLASFSLKDNLILNASLALAAFITIMNEEQ